MKLRKLIASTISECLKENIDNNELTDFSEKENIYYHGTSNNVSSNFILTDFIKNFDQHSSNWSKNIQGIGKFYSKSILNAYSFIDFKNTDVGTIVEIYFKSQNPYNAKNIVKLISQLEDFGAKNNIQEITKRNKMFVEYLINNGYDSIIIHEGPSFNPTSRKLKSEVIIPLAKENIRLLNTYTAKTRNGGIFYN